MMLLLIIVYQFFIANGFVAVGCYSCLLYTKKVLLQMVLLLYDVPYNLFALNKSLFRAKI